MLSTFFLYFWQFNFLIKNTFSTQLQNIAGYHASVRAAEDSKTFNFRKISVNFPLVQTKSKSTLY